MENLNYYHRNEVVPDVFTVDFLLINKAGRDVPFQPEGELTFREQSGKEYLILNVCPGKFAPLNLKSLRGQHEEFQELIKKDGLRRITCGRQVNIPLFWCGIDRGHKITALIYRNETSKKNWNMTGYNKFC